MLVSVISIFTLFSFSLHFDRPFFSSTFLSIGLFFHRPFFPSAFFSIGCFFLRPFFPSAVFSLGYFFLGFFFLGYFFLDSPKRGFRKSFLYQEFLKNLPREVKQFFNFYRLLPPYDPRHTKNGKRASRYLFSGIPIVITIRAFNFFNCIHRLLIVPITYLVVFARYIHSCVFVLLSQ